MAFLLVKLRISNSPIQIGTPWRTVKALWALCLLCTLSFLSFPQGGFASGADCDRLAAIAADPDRQATPVDYAGIDGQQVVTVCREALRQSPNNGRFWVQLGRGYLKLEQGDAMLDSFEKAQSLDYPVAWFALAVVYHTGNGVAEANLDRAEKLYKAAYQRGVGYAALGLARLYDEPESPFFDLDKADVWQSRFDDMMDRRG